MTTHNDTICAIATAPGGAIGIVRVSGERAIEIADSIFQPSHPTPLSEKKAYTLSYGQIIDNHGEVIDDVLVSLFRAPHSYTGEDAVEIACHGSTYILQQLMQRLTEKGCRLAHPGEYTQRAFLNGKMDLSQAEAVADLIASTSAAEHRLAINQMRGGFSRELRQLRDQLLHLTSLMELELDFSDHEDLEFADRSELQTLANGIEQVIERLTSSFKTGNAIKNGVPVVIIGETNAGKSTLLNALLNEDRAIVSDIHGTTRDVIEDTINLGGTTFRLIDTAGIRNTQDTIESIGIERTFKKITQADIILWVVDSTTQTDKSLHEELFERNNNQQLIILYNKCDLISQEQKAILTHQAKDVGLPHLFISAKSRTGLEQLETLLVKIAALPEIKQNDIIVTNLRHYESLTQALDAIHRVQNGISQQLSGDFISQDLRECINHLSDIIGDIPTSSVLQNIFAKFCIGK